MATANKQLSAYDKNTLPHAEAFRFGMVVSDWNHDITHNLLQGCIDTLTDCGAKPDALEVFHVPGSFELVYGARQLVATGRFDAVVVIGCVIEGETRHFDFVCQGVTQGVAQLNAQQNVPVIFCVLTDSSHQQSVDRSGGAHGNKGVEAGVTALQMAAFRQQTLR